MCGIAGAILSSGSDAIGPVRSMCAQMQRRGPDAMGEWVNDDGSVCFGHRRLSIIDLDARANQPLASSDGRHLIVFNGEIYNYKTLRESLKRDGVTLRTSSDTEAILELYRKEGVAVFSQLRGMFALAIWDVEENSIVFARDPYGIKPLYIAKTSKGLLFASQVKALVASGLVSRTINNGAVAGFYIWGSVPEPLTLYDDVRPVPAGSYVIVDREGASRTGQYADVSAAWSRRLSADSELSDRVRAALESSVRAHLVSDVPVAVLLSGGVDSGAIAGLMAQFGQAVEGVTVSFAEFAGGPRDEVPRAREIARSYALKHTVRSIDRSEFVADMPAILDAMDQPSIDGVNTWFATKAIAERGYKVALSGIGGDEIFCGYDTFQTTPRLNRLGRAIRMTGPLGRLAGPAFALAARLAHKPKLAAIPAFAATLDGAYMLQRALLMPNELELVMRRDAVEDGLARLADATVAKASDDTASMTGTVAMLESTRYLRNQLLRDSDWASMAHSIELRTPLVDWELLSALAPYADSFVSGVGKRMLAEAPHKPLPPSILDHRKTGFGLPIGEWLVKAHVHDARIPIEMRKPWARRWAGIVAEAFEFT